ncbi:amidase [Gloeobacter morelensis]|uniref:Amidase n=1 Tax=Gloeobacter morelensis MG652769 TaxID=2781736 RepID=A0ABY3PMV5_9CYAN|nr:amidase [Gloeobacter morelensis]UFP95021.1 amidase [Gloeobacter morelensis MG652769]
MPSRRDFLAIGFGSIAAATLPRSARARAASADPAELTLAAAARLVRAGAVSSVELVQACLANIDKHDKQLNTFITVSAEQALAEAREAQAQIRRGDWRGPLHGIPLAIKDNIDTAGMRTTAASALFADRVPDEDAEVVRRLKAAGAVLLGKVNLHEFALGGTSAVSYFGAVHNPWILDRAAGGSSGGSAAAVACRMCFGALGTDTGGSIRTPASFCGIVGLKPTYGRVSNRNVIPLVWSLDHVGPMTRSVEDAALILNAIAGYDPQDLGSVDRPVPDYTAALAAPTAGLRVGVPQALFYDRLDPDVEAAVAGALEVLRGLTAEVRDVRLPMVASAASIGAAEIYAYHRPWFERSRGLYQISTRKRLDGAGKASGADYVHARREVERLRREVVKIFDTVDVLVTPTTPRPPYTIEQSLKRDETEQLPPVLSNPGPFNVFGLPAISIPCGFTRDGLPIGLQIVGAPFAEIKVLTLAHAYERATGWHSRKPTMKPTSPTRKATE